MITKTEVIFDPAFSDEHDNIGAYIRSADGTMITHTTDGAKERLDVTLGAEYAEGTAFAGGERGVFTLAVDDNGDFRPLRVNADGELLVDVTVTTGADKAEDSAHTTGDIGSFVLSVRQDTLATSTDASGDYQAFKTDSLGALWTRISQIPQPNGFTSWLVTQNTVDATAELVVPADLTGRKKILIQNVSVGANRHAFIGHANTVTDSGTTGGIKLAAGGAFEMELAAGVAVYAIGLVAGVDLRIAEMAA